MPSTPDPGQVHTDDPPGSRDGFESVDRTEPTAAIEGAGQRERVTNRGAIALSLMMLCLAIAVPVSAVVAHVAVYTKLSPIDELQHIDYLLRSPELVVVGDLVQEEAMRSEACRGIDADFTPPPCESTDLRPEQFQELGFNTAAIHPPTYYSLTALFAVPLVPLASLDEVTAGRLVGAFWLGLGLLLTWVAGRRLKIDPLPLSASLLLVGLMPVAVYSSSIVNPDAMSLPVGAACLLLVLEAEKRTGPWNWLLLAGSALVAVMVKTQNFIIIVCLGLYLLIRAWSSRRWQESEQSSAVEHRPGMSFVRLALGLGVLTIFLVLAWLRTVSTFARVPAADIPMNTRFEPKDGLPLTRLAESIGVFFPPSDTYLSPFLTSAGVKAGIVLTGFVLVAGCVGVGWFLNDIRPELRALGRAVTVTAVLGAPLMVLANYLLLSADYSIPPRYGSTLVPAMAVCLAAAVRSFLGRALLAGLGGVIGVVTLATILR